MGWDAIEPWGIYVALSIHDESVPNYHWSFYIPFDEDRGQLYEAVDNATHKWVIDTRLCMTLRFSTRLTAMMKVGQISNAMSDTFNEIVMNPSLKAPRNGQEFSCRVWILNALGSLDAAGLVTCKDVYAFEQEAVDIAKANKRSRGEDITVAESSYSG